MFTRGISMKSITEIRKFRRPAPSASPIRSAENVKLFIVLKEGQTATAEEMIEYGKAHLATYKLPTEVEFRKELPKSTVGKVLRKELRAEELKKRKA